jgi:hypothetical protein
MTDPFKFASRGVQIGAIANFERGGLIGRGSGEVAQRVFALVRLEIDRVLRSVCDFETR